MGKKRRTYKRRDFTQRAGSTNHHHLKNRCHGGTSVMSNLLRMDERRHDAWHLLFKNMDLPQIIRLLQRLQKIKEGQCNQQSV